nr:inositol monophosphatase family protein [Chthonobacter rhizosphaerae]
MRIVSDIADEAAALALSFFRRHRDLEARSKGMNDPVSEADVAVERFIRGQLAAAFPGDGLLGEEDGGELAETGYWAIDPIDGTTNFLRGSPLWAVSIGYVRAGRPRLGVVVLPALGERFAAQEGFGPFVNGRRFTRAAGGGASRVISLGDSNDDDLSAMADLYADLRRTGHIVECFRCTALGLAFAAKGIVDGHVQRRTTVWDMAGGTALCLEAGLTVSVGSTATPKGWSVEAVG